jgi:DNA-binding beta-propeller fold protein YncE
MSRRVVIGTLAGSALTLALVFVTFSPAFARSSSAAPYRLAQTVRLGPPNDWDYLAYDPSSGRVFVAHGNRLTVVDASSGKIVGHVGPIPGGPHGIAFDHAAGVGITDDGRIGQAVIFGLKTLKIVKRLTIQRGADAVTFDPVSGHAFVIDGDTGDIAVIDPARGRVVTFVHVGGDLEYAVPGGHGELYVNGVTHHEIFRINTATNRIDARWPMPQCRKPHGLAIDTVTHRLFSSCQNRRLVVVDSENGTVVSAVPIGGGTDADRFDPNSKLVFSSNGFDGTLSVIREINADTFVRVATIKTALSGRTMALDPATGRVFIAAARPPSVEAWQKWAAAFRAGKHVNAPFVPDSLELLVFDPVR